MLSLRKPPLWILVAAVVAALAAPSRTLAQSSKALSPARPEFSVIGYLPDYRVEAINESIIRQLTDLIVFSAEPTPAGGIDLERLKGMPWDRLRALKTRHRVRLILCVGGWDRSKAFPAVAASPQSRQKFVEAAVRLCLAERLDGLDLDWEHPADVAQQTAYAVLLTDLSDAFRPHGLMLSVTMAAWQQIPAEGLAAVDRVQLMAYDNPGAHSTFEAAQKDVRSLLDRKVPADRIVLGLPFYGRHLKNRDDSLTWRQIVEKHHPVPTADEAAGYAFNGPATIRRKTEYARQNGLAGVMVWELGQDAPGEASLLGVIQAARSAAESR
jgi:GH18 family chitinase